MLIGPVPATCVPGHAQHGNDTPDSPILRHSGLRSELPVPVCPSSLRPMGAIEDKRKNTYRGLLSLRIDAIGLTSKASKFLTVAIGRPI